MKKFFLFSLISLFLLSENSQAQTFNLEILPTKRSTESGTVDHGSAAYDINNNGDVSGSIKFENVYSPVVWDKSNQIIEKCPFSTCGREILGLRVGPSKTMVGESTDGFAFNENNRVVNFFRPLTEYDYGIDGRILDSNDFAINELINSTTADIKIRDVDGKEKKLPITSLVNDNGTVTLSNFETQFIRANPGAKINSRELIGSVTAASKNGIILIDISSFGFLVSGYTPTFLDEVRPGGLVFKSYPTNELVHAVYQSGTLRFSYKQEQNFNDYSSQEFRNINNSGLVAISGDFNGNHIFNVKTLTSTPMNNVSRRGLEIKTINSRSQVLVNAYKDSNSNHVQAPFIWEGGNVLYLNSLVAPYATLKFLSAEGMNDCGQIVGKLTYKSKEYSYRLSPLVCGKIFPVNGLNANLPTDNQYSAVIGDKIWKDANRNGLQDSNEEGISGVKIDFSSSDGRHQGQVVSGAGSYQINVLPNTTYTIKMSDPSNFGSGAPLFGLTPTLANVGTDDKIDSDIDSNATVTVKSPGAGVQDLTVDAGWVSGEFDGINKKKNAFIGDRVWNDKNDNGIQDTGEPGISGVEIVFASSDGKHTEVTYSGSNGAYKMTVFPNTLYSIKFGSVQNFQIGGALFGFGMTIPNIGNDSLDSDPTRRGAFGEAILQVTSPSADVYDSTIDSGWVPFFINGVPTGNPIPTGLKDSCDDGVAIMPITSPTYTLWNGFLEMTNILELVNTDKSASDVEVIIYYSNGTKGQNIKFRLNAGEQRDLILNQFTGFAKDAYGMVEIRFTGTIDGRLMYYKQKVESKDPNTFDYAFGVPLSAPNFGETSVNFNTFSPSTNPVESTFLVYNWLSIVNISDIDQDYTIVTYDISGKVVKTSAVSLKRFGRVDIDGGHGTLGKNSLGYHKIIPKNSNAPYIAQLIRYGDVGGKIGFATPLVGQKSQQTFDLPITRRLDASNWLEIVNTTSNNIVVNVKLYNKSGALVHSRQTPIKANSQAHIDARLFLDKEDFGTAKITSDKPGSIITQSMVYYFKESGRMSAMYGVQGKVPTGSMLLGSYNRFLTFDNLVKVMNTSLAPAEICLKIRSTGYIKKLTLSPSSSAEFNLSEGQTYGTKIDTYGVFSIGSKSNNVLIAENVRIKKNANKLIEIAAPTEVR